MSTLESNLFVLDIGYIKLLSVPFVFTAQRYVNGTQTSSSREMIQSAFISLTHSSTCQVRSLNTDNTTGLIKNILISKKGLYMFD